jgi:benzoate-CoA ligase family protein
MDNEDKIMQNIEVPEYFNQAEYLTDRHLKEGRANNIAIYYRDQKINYAQLSAMVNQTGNALKELGVEIENRVMIALPDSPELFYTYLGAMKIGAVPIPVNTLASPKEYIYYLNDSRAKVLFLTEDIIPRIESVKNDLLYLRHIVVVGSAAGNYLNYDKITSGAPTALATARTSKDDMACWMYTSGTTGVPKGVVHLHHDLLFCIPPVSEEVIDITEKDRIFVTSKIFFTYGRNHSLELPLMYGASVILHPEWSVPRKVFDIVREYRPTLFFSVPTFYNMMLKEADEPNFSFDFTSIRQCISAGESLSKDIYQRWKARFGLDIVNSLGSTDVGGLYLSCRKEQIRPGSAGKLLPGFEGVLKNDEGGPVTAGEIGSLWVKNDGVAAMYWNKHQKTKEVFQGYWFNTGDLFRQDSEGYFWFQSRGDDMLKISGQWVSPVEIEEVLLKHPAVSECAVIGNPDEAGLLKVKAFVTLNKSFQAAPELEKELIAFAFDRLAHFKAPRRIEFIPEMPRTATGKLQRYKLRKG